MALRHARWVEHDDPLKERIRSKMALIPCPNGCGTEDIRPVHRPRRYSLLGESKEAKRQFRFYLCQHCMTLFLIKVQKLGHRISKAQMSK